MPIKWTSISRRWLRPRRTARRKRSRLWIITSDFGAAQPLAQLGTGGVDFKGVFTILKRAGFNGPIMVECCAVGDTAEATAANARANREFLERALEEI